MIQATDNSVVTFYNNVPSACFIESHNCSFIYIDEIAKTQNINFNSTDTSFINFPGPYLNKETFLSDEKTTGINTDLNNFNNNKLQGKMTSLLINDGSNIELTKLQDGICLSDIKINVTDFTELINYLKIIPRNLNGFNLYITYVEPNTT